MDCQGLSRYWPANLTLSKVALALRLFIPPLAHTFDLAQYPIHTQEQLEK